MKYLLSLIICFWFAAFYIGCIDDDKLKEDPRLAQLDEVIPSIGYIGDTVRVIGSKFDAVDSIYFNGTRGTIINKSETQLLVLVPQGASTGPVSLQNSFGLSIGPDYTVLPDTVNLVIAIDSLSPASGLPGDSVQVYGRNFNALNADFKLFFTEQESPHELISTNLIMTVVPHAALSGQLIITNNSDTIIGPIFTVLQSPPIITSINPTEGQVLTEVMIAGDNFGTELENIKVTINNDSTRVISITNQEIVFEVPEGSSTGPISMINLVTDDTTEGPVFTVLPPDIVITSISPTSGPEFTQVVIVGENFGDDINDLEVSLNGEIVDANLNSDTQIGFVVPDGATTGPVVVTNTATNQVATGPVFTVTDPLPVATVSTFLTDNVGNAIDIFGIANVFILVDDRRNWIRLFNTDTKELVYTAGTGEPGFSNGANDETQFRSPRGILAFGPTDYIISDSENHVLRLFTAGQSDTFAGIGQAGFTDGTITNAQFNSPSGLAYDNNNFIYVSDTENHAIRAVNLTDSTVTTLVGNGTPGFSDGNMQTARLNSPTGLFIDNNTNILYIADFQNHAIRTLDLNTGILSTLAGSGTNGFLNGSNTNAQFSFPTDIAVDSQGIVYVADGLNNRIRKIDQGQTTTFAGDGIEGNRDGEASQARFYFPASLTLLSDSELLVGDYFNEVIRKITIE